MSYSNLDTFSTISMDNIKTIYNLDFFTNQIYKLTNKENQRIALFENSVTSGVLKKMNDIKIKLEKDEDNIYSITFLVDSINQDPIEVNGDLSAFRLPLYISIFVKNCEVTFRTFVDITFSSAIENVYSNPNSYGFKLSFSTTRIRNVLSSVGNVFMVEITYITPPVYITQHLEHKLNYKLIKNPDNSVSDVCGKLMYNIIRCI